MPYDGEGLFVIWVILDDSKRPADVKCGAGYFFFFYSFSTQKKATLF